MAVRGTEVSAWRQRRGGKRGKRSEKGTDREVTDELLEVVMKDGSSDTASSST